MLEQGDVAEFYYLWHREAEKGEESGWKPRPVCIVIKTPGNPDVVFLFPFTTLFRSTLFPYTTLFRSKSVV